MRLAPPTKRPEREAFQRLEFDYTASARWIEPDLGVLEYLQLLYPFVRPEQVGSLYGFTKTFSPLYGGRRFAARHGLARHHLEEMEERGIGLSLNLTNHYFDEAAFEASRALLEQHHRPGSSITCFNDELARRIRAEFPEYRLHASIIKNLNSVERVEAALALYDRVVIPMERNDDVAFLQALPEKGRIILFADASCAYNCPSRSCYVGFSQEIQRRPVTADCSIPKYERERLGRLFFDLGGLGEMGFRHFKLVPPIAMARWRALRRTHQEHKSRVVHRHAEREGRLIRVASYPKAGRTWLRYFLALYVAELRGLDLEVDLDAMFTLFPNDSEDALKGRPALNTLFRDRLPCVRFTHADYQPEWARRRTLLLLRAIPDTLVSAYFHFSRHRREGEVPIGIYLLGDDGREVRRLCAFLNGWAAQPEGEHRLRLSYEAMRERPVASFRRVLEFFGVTIDRALIERTVERASFERMRAVESARPIPGHDYDLEDREARRVRRGEVGGYRNYLGPAVLAEIEALCERELSAAAKGMLGEQGLWPW